MNATEAAAVVAKKMADTAGFWVGVVVGPDAIRSRLRLRLQAKAAWEGWRLSSTVCNHAEELALLPDRLDAQGASRCALTWIEGHSSETTADESWDFAWDDLILHLELGLNAYRRSGSGGIVLAGPPDLSERLSTDAVVLWTECSLLVAVAETESTKAETTPTGGARHLPLPVDPGEIPASQKAAPLSANRLPRAARGDSGTAADGDSAERRLRAALRERDRREHAESSRPRHERLAHLSLSDLLSLGKNTLEKGRLDESKEAFEQAAWLLLDGPQASAALVVGTMGRVLANGLNQLGVGYEESDRASSARDCYARSVRLRRVQLDRQPTRPARRRELLVALNHLGDGEWGCGNTTAAARAYEEAVDLARRVRNQSGDRSQSNIELAMTLMKLGDMFRSHGSANSAMDAFTEAASALKDALEILHNDIETMRLAVVVLGRLAESCRAASELDRAKAAYQDKVRLEAKLSYALSEQGASR